MDRFWSDLWAPRGVRGIFAGPTFATIFDQKSKKWYPKKHAKMDAEKVSKNYAKWVQNEAKIDAEIIVF